MERQEQANRTQKPFSYFIRSAAAFDNSSADTDKENAGKEKHDRTECRQRCARARRCLSLPSASEAEELAVRSAAQKDFEDDRRDEHDRRRRRH